MLSTLTNISLLRTDAFSGLRTSFIGKLMEESYSQCNRESGKSCTVITGHWAQILTTTGRGSDKRKKKIIGDRLSNENVFVSLQRSFKNRFRVLVENLQSDIQATVATHLSVITNTLDIVRNENVALESERDPEFRRRVETKVEAVIEEVRRLQGVTGSSTIGDGSRVTLEV
jgi:hypothetical protein